MKQTPVYFLNNCQGSDHAALYGDANAFYDLSIEGRHEKALADLAPGHICIVCGRPNSRDEVTFSWHEYQTTRLDSDRETRVFIGNTIASELLDKSVAAKHQTYSPFFTKLGHFKQANVLKREVNMDSLRLLDPQSELYPDEITAPPSSLPDGAKRQIVVNGYERNREARRLCIAYHTCSCAVCGFNFGETFGDFAEGYIHVHHLTPLHEIDGEHAVDPVNDLIPVCPNCHAAIHLGGENRTIEEMRSIVDRSPRG